MTSKQVISAMTAVVLMIGASAMLATAQEELPEGFVSLMPETGLEGWVMMAGNPERAAQAWRVAEDGRLICDGRYGGWLRSEKSYKDFVLRFEYAICRGGNSGVFLRATEKGNPAFTGMELQIADDYGKRPTTRSAMSLYGSVAPAQNLSKRTGGWNTVEVTCQGSRLQVVWNGEEALDVDLSDPTIPYKETPLPERAQEGYIGLQNHGSMAQFRSITIKELE